MPPRLRLGLLALAATSSMALSGCIAAALPAAAAAGVFKSSQDRKARRAEPQATPRAGKVSVTADGKAQVTTLSALPAPDGSAARTIAPDAAAPPEMQYLYGSGEAAALSLQAYQALWNFLRIEIGLRRDKSEIRSVVMAPGSTIVSPKFELCGKRPLALVLDVDETVLLNLGYEADAAVRGSGFDAARWARWEATGADKVAAVPGAAETLAAARREGITVIFNSNRSAATAAQTQAALERAGLGPAKLFDTLWLRGEGEPGGKDARRARIAQRYCIVAMAGDQLGDFSDLFNDPELGIRARRNSASETMIAPLWGAGWFLLPNPVYGTALKGSVDEIFPPETRWADPMEKR
ncbi:HAD family acid phosphatase [Sphingomonas sp. M1-B02]|uniref:HAD family acid phosphatase n=1 Tax=Sphingomonas sp. M1-B02 TaxID=3114300 RepID=UPI00223FA605|nr:HAD family acid phosphatase [Sphingomonas sp. S6-11]UZK66156.1 acid phosphatase [Sphingomonas sp. S6-11]